MINKMNTLKKIKFCAALLAIFPVVAFAAYNDVTLTTDTVITTNGTVNVSGSSATIESITVNDLNFSVVLQPNSTATLNETGAHALLSSDTSVVSSNTCSGGTSTMALSNTGSDSVTTLVSVLESGCSGSSGSTSHGGNGSPGAASGGGGGGGSSVPAGPPPSPTPVVAQVPTSPVSASAEITKSLKKGSVGNEVKSLQKVLNSDPATQITNTGVGSPGNETTLFGSMTLTALKKFQVKYGISGPGKEGYGVLGPKTRKKVNEILGTMKSSSTVAPSASQNSANASDASAALQKQIQDTLAKIKALQDRIKAVGH